MNDIREDIVSLRERLTRVLNNNKELRGALKEVCIRCEGQLKKENINVEMHLEVNIFQKSIKKKYLKL